MLSWLELVGTGPPPISCWAMHFLHYAPDDVCCAENRYVREVEVHRSVLDEWLGTNRFFAGDT